MLGEGKTFGDEVVLDNREGAKGEKVGRYI